MRKNSEKRELIQKIVSISITFIAFLTAFFVFAQVSFGWFAFSTTVSGNGMGVQVQAIDFLEIRASESGENVGVSQIDKETISIDFPDGETKSIYPGVSGKFSFYVHDGSIQEQNPYAFGYRIEVKNDEFYEGEDFPKGFYPGVTDEDKEKALQYLSSHILFFEHRSGNVFSGWISPESYSPRNVAGAQEAKPCEVAVYWVWVANYEDIFNETSALLEEQTRNDIQDFYLKEGNIDKIMFGGENSLNAFNAADTLIGITVKYICFQIEVVSF